MSRKPKILIWDAELSTIDLLIKNYGLKNFRRYFSTDEIQRDWILLSVAWKWYGKRKTHCIAINPKDPENDENVVREFYKVLSEADVIIGHNMKAFDIKKFNSKILQYNLDPLLFRPNQIIDTLTISRRYFSHTSNKLSYVAKLLGVEDKSESPDWNKVLSGDKKEINYMKKYNRQDVIVTEQVYERLKGWHQTHINLDTIADTRDVNGDKVDVCKVCLSPDLIKYGSTSTIYGRKQKYQCKGCGATNYGKTTRVTNIG